MLNDAPPACAGRYPHRSWRDLCLDGTVPQGLADHLPLARGWEKMSKHSVPASDVPGLLRRFAELKQPLARWFFLRHGRHETIDIRHVIFLAVCVRT